MANKHIFVELAVTVRTLLPGVKIFILDLLREVLTLGIDHVALDVERLAELFRLQLPLGDLLQRLLLLRGLFALALMQRGFLALLLLLLEVLEFF